MAGIRYGSVCSGIEAASVAWEPLGWSPAWFAEIEPFPNAVLAHHWPRTPNLGDITGADFLQQAESCGPIDVLVGGTPCQGFSTSGSRGGIRDPRSALALRFIEIARTLRPPWLVWENVPGALTTAGGRDFGAFLGQVADCGYRWAYRVLDAQFFGVPQRRRRVFLVGHLGTGRPDEVLFEPEGEGRHPPTGGETESGAAGPAAPGPHGMTGRGRSVYPCLRSNVYNNSDPGMDADSLILQRPLVYQCHRNNVGPMGTLRKGDGGLTSGVPFVAMAIDVYNQSLSALNPTLWTGGSTGHSGAPNAVLHDTAARDLIVRRLTPRECERLQGFPDDHTLVPYRKKRSPDGPRYKAVGNSIAVPVLRWLGERLAVRHPAPGVV